MTQGGSREGMTKFFFVWLGQLATMFGSSLGSFALGVWVYQKTGSVVDLTLVAFFGSIPGILIAPLAGALVDRWDRRWTMIAADTVAGLCTLAMALLYLGQRLEIWQIYVLVTILRVTAVFQGPAFSASVPLMVPKRHLGRASGMMQAAFAISQVGAPVVAGVLIVTIGLGGIMIIDFATFVLGVLPLLLIRIPRPEASEEGARRGSFWREALDGWRYLLDRPGLAGLLSMFAVTNISLGLVSILLTPLVLSFSDAQTLGRVMSISALGVLIGSLVISVWGGPRRRVRAILMLTALQGVLLIAAGMRANVVLITVVAFVFLLLDPVLTASGRVIWQTKIPPDLQGRIFATRRMIAGGTLPLAYLASGPLTDRVFEPLMAPGGALAGSLGQVIGVGSGRGIGLLMILLGLLMIVAAAVASFFPRLRKLEREIPDTIRDQPAAASAPPAAKGSATAADPEAAAAAAEAVPAGGSPAVTSAARSATRMTSRAGLLEDLGMDLRQTLGSLLRHKLLTASVCLSLALGIGANIAVYSMIKGIFLRPLPVEKPTELISIFTTQKDTPGYLFLSYPVYEALRDGNRVFSGLAAYRPVTVRLRTENGTERMMGDIVSGNYFQVIGVPAAAGRAIGPQDDQTPGAHPVIMLTHGAWQRRFAGDPDIIGRTLQLNDHAFTVIGVTPPSFTSLHVHGAPDFFVPMMMHDQVLTGNTREWFHNPGALLFFSVGRLKPEVGRQQAEAAIQTQARALREQFDAEDLGMEAVTMPLIEASIHPNLRGQFVLVGGGLLAVVGILLLIACANIAGLLMVRSLDRRREMAIRSALGAGRGRLSRLLLVEGLVLSLLGGAVGILFSVVLRDFLWSLRSPQVGGFLDIGLDGSVLFYTLFLSLLTGVLFSLAPIARTHRARLVPALKQGQPGAGQSPWGVRGLLMIAQVALSMAALVGAGLFLRSVENLQRVDPGFRTENLVLLDLEPSAGNYSEAAGREYYSQVMRRVEALPGVAAVSVGRGTLLAGTTFRQSVEIEGREQSAPGEGTLIFTDPVGEGYFDTLEMPIQEGRALRRTDRSEAVPVAVINRTMADFYWRGDSPIGKRFRISGQELSIEVVGVVADAKYRDLAESPLPYIYRPLEQMYSPEVTLYVRTETPPRGLIQAIRSEAEAVDPSLAVQRVRTMDQLVGRALATPRWAAFLLGLLGVIALILVASGLYGIIAYSVRNRRREVGVRMALGARKGDVLGLFLRQGLILVFVGVGLGLLVAFGLASLMAGLLLDASVVDPWISGGAAALLLLVAAVATYLPARQAVAFDPIQALRID